MLLIQLCGLSVFPLLLVIAALQDMTSFTIPNWIAISAVVAFPPIALVAGLAPSVIGLSILLGLSALVLGVAMFALGWIGGGDAKLIAACGLWTGWAAFGPFLLLTAAAGGILAMALLLLRKGSFWVPVAMPTWARRLATQGESVPYGVAIAAGALMAFPRSPLAAALSHAIA